MSERSTPAHPRPASAAAGVGGDKAAATAGDQAAGTAGDGRPPGRPRRRPLRTAWRLVARTLTKAWDDSIFSLSAMAAFWQVLSLPPLLLGLLGSLGYVGGWFGPDTVDIIEAKIISVSSLTFTESVVEQIIAPTVQDVLGQGRAELVSVGFIISLWAGSSAVSAFVDSIVEAHGQTEHRHPVWQRFFSLLLYVFFLVLAVFTLPLVALGPTVIGRIIPPEYVDVFYYPAVAVLLLVGLTTLYKVALPRTLPWHRLLGGAVVAGTFFFLASAGLRTYLSTIARTGYSYGALATPIAFLLFAFFLGFSIVLGAEFNAAVQEFWPARATRIEQMREWLAQRQTTDPDTPLPTALLRLASESLRGGDGGAGGQPLPGGATGESEDAPPGPAARGT